MEQIKFPKFKTYTDQKVNYIQPKLDGHLTKIYKHAKSFPPRSDAIIAYTKNDKDITEKLLAINHIRKELDGLPCNSQIFAELHCPGVHATSVPTMLNEANKKLQLTVFAAPLLDGKDISNKHLTDVMFIIQELGLDATHADIWSNDIIDEGHKLGLLQTAIDRGWEGWVLKEAHMKNWYKLKPVQTVDVFVIGTYQSFSSTHYGGLQSIGIAAWHIPSKNYQDLGNVGSGFTLEYRKQFDTKEKRNKLLGRVCEVAFDSVAANGKLRFPRFLRWRKDKDPEQCTMEQLECK